MTTEITQAEMVHHLPPAQLVDRVGFLIGRAQGASVIHVGFADSRCSQFHGELDAWLHDQLDKVASDLVGLDIDADGVDHARTAGFTAHQVDCTDPEAVHALGLEPARVVVAGELIEHLSNPGAFLEAAHSLVAEGGELVITTPNAHGLMNSGAALAGYEVNHPDHVTLFSIITLTRLLQQHGWTITTAATYVPEVKPAQRLTRRLRVLSTGASAVLGLERLLAKAGRPFVADGLIVVAESAR